MISDYYTCRIRLAPSASVQLEIRDSNNKVVQEPRGGFGLHADALVLAAKLQAQVQQPKVEPAVIKELGRLLFSGLFDPPLRQSFFDLYEKAGREDSLLRVELDVDEGQFPKIAALPWELMYWPAEKQQGELWPAAAPHMVFARRRAIWHTPLPCELAFGERLRIAVAVAAPQNLGKVQYERVVNELRMLAQTERFEIIAVEKSADRSKVDALLEKRPHIFHFIGHGRITGDTPYRAEVALENQAGNADWIGARNFGELFNRHRPALVVLHACQSAGGAFDGVASQLVQMRVPAVAAMQFEISNAAAQQFVLEMYRRLSNDEPVDKAVQEGRRHLLLRSGSNNKAQFATPVLFMCIGDNGRLFRRRPPADPKRKIEELAENARRMTARANFGEAIKTWKDLRDLDPRDERIDYELDDLEKKRANQASLQALLRELSSRMPELTPPFYLRVAQKLKRLAKENLDDMDEYYPALVKQFIDGQISGTDLERIWNEASAKAQSELKPDLALLAARLNRGDLIPIFGLDMLNLLGLPVPSRLEMVTSMAQEVSYEGFRGSLPMICQYHHLYGRGRRMVNETVRDLVSIPIDANHHLCMLLGHIRAPLLVISTSYDCLLEKAFDAHEKKYAVLSHYLQTGAQMSFGKLRLKQSEPGHPDAYRECTADDISGLKLLENGYSVIYRICGAIDALPEAPLLLMENDFFVFSRYLEQSIPPYITRQFVDRGFLFMGYDLEEWQDRLIANAILYKRTNRDDSSFAIWHDPTPYAEAFWKSHRVDLCKLQLTDFVSQLHAQIGR